MLGFKSSLENGDHFLVHASMVPNGSILEFPVEDGRNILDE